MTPETWLAWHRPSPRYRWRVIARGATEDEAFQMSRAACLSGDHMIRPASAGDPNRDKVNR